jgi:hypothetical protein
VAYYGGQGDFYRGVGDPGIFDFVGKAVGGALHFIPGVGPLASALATVGGIGHKIVRKQTGATTGELLMSGYDPVQASLRAQARRAHEGGLVLGGGKGKRLKHLPKHLGGRGFGHRRMNVANVRALKRSIRRLVGFYELSHKVMKELSKLAHKRHHRFPTAAPQHRIGGHRGQRLLPPPRGDFYEGA